MNEPTDIDLKNELRVLFEDIEGAGPASTPIRYQALSEAEIEERVLQVRCLKGRFLRLLRENAAVDASAAGSLIDLKTADYIKFESGLTAMLDSDFNRLCAFFGAEEQAALFLAELSKTFSPPMPASEPLQSAGASLHHDSKPRRAPGQVLPFRARPKNP